LHARDAHFICMQHLDRFCRVQTTNGYVDGVIVYVDDAYVYVRVTAQQTGGAGGTGWGTVGGGGCGCGGGTGGRDSRQFYPGFGYPYPFPYYQNAILPLSLFTLLAIALI